jgi:DNA-directed RNA polymerase specialized sigma subunit
MGSLDALAIVEMVDALPEREREVINGIFWERASLSTIGRRINASKSMVAFYRDRALRRLGVSLQAMNAALEEQ